MATNMAAKLFRTFLTAAGVACSALVIGAGQAGAISDKVRNSCQSDYFKFCPSYAVGSTALRQCMRQVGNRLSPRCVDALVESGEIRRTARR